MHRQGQRSAGLRQGWLWLRLRQRLGGALTALVVALVTANGGSEQTVGTTATAKAGKLRAMAEAGRGNERCEI